MFRKFYRKHKEIINYLVIGGLTTLLSLGTYYGLVLTILDPKKALQLQAANIISWIIAVAFSYFANRWFVFYSRNKNIVKEVALFYLARLATLFVDMAIMFFTVTCFKMNDKIMKLIVQVIVIVLNYLFSKFLVFSNKAL